MLSSSWSLPEFQRLDDGVKLVEVRLEGCGIGGGDVLLKYRIDVRIPAVLAKTLGECPAGGDMGPNQNKEPAVVADSFEIVAQLPTAHFQVTRKIITEAGDPMKPTPPVTLKEFRFTPQVKSAVSINEVW